MDKENKHIVMEVNMRVCGMKAKCTVMERSYTLTVTLTKENLKPINATAMALSFKPMARFMKDFGLKIDRTEKENKSSEMAQFTRATSRMVLKMEMAVFLKMEKKFMMASGLRISPMGKANKRLRTERYI